MLTVQDGELLRKKRKDIVAQMVKTPPANAGDMGSIPVGKISWRSKWQPTPIFFPEKPYGQGSLAGCSPGGPKESDTTERLSTRVFNVSYLARPSGTWVMEKCPLSG